MTQMYGKLGLIITILGLFSGHLVSQDKTGVPILLQTESEAQKEPWKTALINAFVDETLIWADDPKEADIVITADEDSYSIDVRQNAIQRLSPILEPAPSIELTSDEDLAAIMAVIWPLTQGECVIEEEETPLDLIDPDIRAVYEGNCLLLAAYAEDPVDQNRVVQAQHLFEDAASVRAAKVNLIWLVHEVGDKFFTRELISLEVLNPAVTASEQAFWTAKRGQFHALDFDFQAALRDLDRSIEADPENPLYLTLKGEVYLLLYEWNNANAVFEAAIALNPDFALAYFQRGVLLSTMTEIDAANADFSRYLALAPRGVYAELARQYGGEG